MQIPFAQADITEAEEQAVLEVLRSGWLTSGKKMRELEENLAAYVGGDVQAIAVNSATSGLHLALEAVGVSTGDFVAVPTTTFTATAEVVRYMGATPVFIDVEPWTMNMSVSDLRKKAERCVAVIPVHFAGLPCSMTAICEIAQQYGLAVIEDAAHALGSTYHGKKIGAGPTHATVFSFYATKCMTTAEGGAVVTRWGHLADRMRQMRLHGISRDVFDRYTSGTAGWEYDVIAPGFKYNMPDVLAALGVEQLKRLDAMKNRRQAIARQYVSGLTRYVGVPIWSDDHCWHLFVIFVAHRDQFIDRMYAKGIGCSVHFKPLHKMTYWKPFAVGKYNGSEVAYSSCVSLPIYSKMTDEQVQYVIEAVKECVRS